MKTKHILIGTGVLLSGIAAFFIIRKFKSKGQTPKGDDNGDGGNNDNNVASGQPLLSQSKANELAQKLRGAMGRAFGTDEEAIYEVAKECKRPEDWRAITTAFGMQKFKMGFTEHSLGDWLRDELNDDEMRKLVSSLPEGTEII